MARGASVGREGRGVGRRAASARRYAAACAPLTPAPAPAPVTRICVGAWIGYGAYRTPPAPAATALPSNSPYAPRPAALVFARFAGSMTSLGCAFLHST